MTAVQGHTPRTVHHIAWMLSILGQCADNSQHKGGKTDGLNKTTKSGIFPCVLLFWVNILLMCVCVFSSQV